MKKYSYSDNYNMCIKCYTNYLILYDDGGYCYNCFNKYKDERELKKKWYYVFIRCCL